MLVLDEKAMLAAATLEEIMDQVADAFRIFERGEAVMPDRLSVLSGENTVLYMPCFSGDYFGTKVLSLFPGNQAKGAPYIHGVYVLNHGDTGAVAALLEGSLLTALRTGAVGGVGIRCFSREDSRSVGIVGCGTQGFYQALFACKARPIAEIYLFDAYKKDFSGYVEDLRRAVGRPVEIHVCPDVTALLRASEIVVTTTTSQTPVLPDDPELLAGKCFIAIGSYKPHMRELPPAICQVADVITELPYACEESGDLSQPLAEGLLREADIQFIGRLLESGAPLPRPTARRSVLYKSVGMGLLDLQVARLIYEKSGGRGA